MQPVKTSGGKLFQTFTVVTPSQATFLKMKLKITKLVAKSLPITD